MLAEHHVDVGGAGQPPDQGDLVGVGQVVVLVAAVEVHDHDVGAGLAGPLGLGKQVGASHIETDHGRPSGSGKPLRL